jgi:hypothetical protein
MPLSTYPSQDFRYLRGGEYSNRSALPYQPRRGKATSGPRKGRMCPGCGLERSLTDKCNCNS